MYRVPSRRIKRSRGDKPNLVPILDAVFIFIFFLLTSVSYIKIHEIPSVVPILNPGEPPKNEKRPLGLTLRIEQSRITISTGIPARVRHSIHKLTDGRYDLESLRQYLIDLKSKNLDERTVVLEPIIDLTYEELVEIMDAVRLIRRSDPSLYRKDEAGLDERVKELFDNIVFGNIQT